MMDANEKAEINRKDYFKRKEEDEILNQIREVERLFSATGYLTTQDTALAIKEICLILEKTVKHSRENLRLLEEKK